MTLSCRQEDVEAEVESTEQGAELRAESGV